MNRHQTHKPELISTDAAKPYVDRVVERFARYKRPGSDAEAIAREILTHDMFLGSVTNEAWETILPRFNCTMGDHATRHLIDIVGWIFEINQYEPGERIFRWAERTHTLKNLRDHLCKDNSRLWEAYCDWCCDHKRHGGSSVGYALGTIGDPEYVEYNRQIKEQIARYKAAKAAGTED